MADDDPPSFLLDDEGRFPLEAGMTEEEELRDALDPSLLLRMTEEEEEAVLTDDDDSFLTEEELRDALDPSLRFEDDDLRRELLLDPIASLQDDEESPSFADVPLSSPQATRAMVSKRTIMDGAKPQSWRFGYSHASMTATLTLQDCLLRRMTSKL